VQQLATRDDEARRVEIANLPVEATARLRRELDADGFGALPPAALLAGCGTRLRERDLATPSGRRRLLAAAVVPDDYDDALRALGAYPLTALPFAAGVRRYEAATHAAFALPLADLPLQGVLRHYQPRPAPTLAAAEVRAVLARARDNPLRLPSPTRQSRRAAGDVRAAAVIDERDNDDRVGRPRFDEGDEGDRHRRAGAVHAHRARLRRRATAAARLHRLVPRARGVVVRPAGGRPTRSSARHARCDGTPLLHDSIRLRLLPPVLSFGAAQRHGPPPTIDEGALTPQRLGRVPGARIACASSRARTLRRSSSCRPRAPPVAPLSPTVSPDDALRTLPRAGGSTQPHAPDGLVRGSEAREQFVFWPMGIASAGAMRQWGRRRRRSSAAVISTSRG
jgi:hypothetical protein